MPDTRDPDPHTWPRRCPVCGGPAEMKVGRWRRLHTAELVADDVPEVVVNKSDRGKKATQTTFLDSRLEGDHVC